MASRFLRTENEEKLNGITHAIPCLTFISLGIFGQTKIELLYCLTYSLMFMFSTVYHLSSRGKDIFRTVDKCFIYATIGITAFLCSPLITPLETLILVSISIFSLLHHMYRQSMSLPDGILIPVIYLFNGIVCTSFIFISGVWSWCLVAGLASFIVGLFFYVNDHNKYYHALWHFWVTGGAVLIYAHIVSNLS